MSESHHFDFHQQDHLLIHPKTALLLYISHNLASYGMQRVCTCLFALRSITTLVLFFFFFFKHYVQVKYISPTAPVASQQYITGQKLMKIEITSADRCCSQVDMSEKKIHFLKK